MENLPTRLTVRTALLCALVVGGPWIAARAEGTPDGSQAVGAQLQQQQLERLLRSRLPAAPSSAIEGAARDFTDHLRQVSPIAAESLSTGRMDPDDLSSRVDVYLGDHPELTSRPATAAADSPRLRVAKLLEKDPDLAASDQERRALADRFLGRLGELSASSLENLMAGRMSDDELQSRVSVFAEDCRAEKNRVAVDPATAAVPGIVDSFEKANLGPVTERPDSICFKGVEDEGDKRREFVVFKKRPNKIRIHMIENGLVIGVIGFDGSVAWREALGKPAARLGGPAAAALEESARFDDPLVGYRERGADVRLESPTGASPISLRITEADGSARIETLDPTTFSETSLRKLRAGGGWAETRFRDYRKFGNLNLSYTQENWSGGSLRSTTRITDVNVDPGLLDRFFSYPRYPNFGFMDLMGGLAVIQARGAHGAPSAGQPAGTAP